jgi:hypothetical protein
MSDLMLSQAQMRRIKPYFPLSRGIPRADDRKIISGIIFVLRNGLRWRELPDITYCNDAYACADGADALVIVTEWVQFRALDLPRLKLAMKQPVVVDLRNVYRPEEMTQAGFTYESVGRGKRSN